MSIKDKPNSPHGRQIGLILLILASVSLLGYLFVPKSSRFPIVPYSEFLDQLDDGQSHTGFGGGRTSNFSA